MFNMGFPYLGEMVFALRRGRGGNYDVVVTGHTSQLNEPFKWRSVAPFTNMVYL